MIVRQANHLGHRTKMVAAILCTFVLLCCWSSSAMAAVGAVSEFGEVGSVKPGGGGIAVNETGSGGDAIGDVYVANTPTHIVNGTSVDNGRILQFSATGNFIRAFGADVGGPGVDVCTVASACGPGTTTDAAGGMVRPEDVAVEQATGNVYVADFENDRIDVFSATGAFEGAFGWRVKVTGAAEELQFCTAVSGCQAGSEGSGAGQFAHNGNTGAQTVAVSPLNGHVLVGDGFNQRISEFAPTVEAGVVTGVSFVRTYGWGVRTGANEFQICTATCQRGVREGTGNGQFNSESPMDIAVDSTGKVYALNHNGGSLEASAAPGRVMTFDAEGHPLGDFSSATLEREGAPPTDIAVDPDDDHVLVFEECGDMCESASPVRHNSDSVIFELDAGGTLLETFFKDAGYREPNRGGIARGPGGDTYLSAARGVYLLGPVVPPVVSIDPPVTPSGTVAELEGKINPTGVEASYGFEFSQDGEHWNAIATGVVPGDDLDHPVTAHVDGLVALTTYHVRLKAAKEAAGGSSEVETSFETPASAPVVSRTTPVEVFSDGAVLKGEINPEKEDTTYQAECADQAAFEASGYADATKVPAEGGVSIGAGGTLVSVGQMVSGLAAGTVYHCRLNATNATGTTAGDEALFKTLIPALTSLPDGRAYEQASPVDKNGSNASGWNYLLKASPDGNAMSYFITGGGIGSEGGQDFPTYEARRGATVWQSHGFLPPSSLGEDAIVLAWSQDLERDYVMAWNSGEKATLYLRNNETATAEPIAHGLSTFSGTAVSAESEDGSEVLFESTTKLTPKATQGVSNLYLWKRGAGSVELVSILPGGTAAFTGAFAGPYGVETSEPLTQGGAAAGSYTQDFHVLSADASKLFFTTSGDGQLYMRKDLDGSSPSTVHISASQKTNGTGPDGSDPKGPQPAAFMQASADGRYVFFLSAEELTNNAYTGSSDQGKDLYRYDTDTGDLIDLAPDDGDAEGAKVRGIVGVSPDSAYVYFAADGVLAPGAGPPESSQVTNLYLYRQGAISFIGRIGTVRGNGKENYSLSNSEGGTSPIRISPVATNGTLLFRSKAQITSYDNNDLAELYLYRPGRGVLCVSCDPTGVQAEAGAGFQSIEPGLSKPRTPVLPWMLRSLTDDGARVFFETREKLVASDENGKQDVYEWEADGSGSCDSESENGGCLFLISSGTSSENSYFADASSSGNDVFFFTTSSLVGQDNDSLRDLYDARVGGGLADQNPAPVVPCAGEACRSQAPPVPEASSPATGTFVGPGNPHWKKKHKRHHHKRHHHRKRHHGKRHHGKKGHPKGGHGDARRAGR